MNQYLNEIRDLYKQLKLDAVLKFRIDISDEVKPTGVLLIRAITIQRQQDIEKLFTIIL